MRVLTRLIEKIRDDFGIKVSGFANHTRRAKRRMLAVMNAKSKKQRKAAYADLLKMADNVMGYSRAALTEIIVFTSNTALFPLFDDIENYLVLLEKVVDQTKRRVMLGETVPAQEKVVSIFEPHTDIIVKDRRDTYYGQYILLYWWRFQSDPGLSDRFRQPGRHKPGDSNAGPAKGNLRQISAQSQFRRRVCFQRQFEGSQVQEDQGCLFREKTRSGRNRYVPQ